MAKKYYAIRKGHRPGIYTSWPEAQKQVSGFSGAEFKSFLTEEEAWAYYHPAKTKEEADPAAEDTVEAYVDGSFDSRTRKYSCGVVLLKNGRVLEKLAIAGNDPRYTDSYQIAGEVHGCLQAIRWAKQNGYKKIVIHYDYMGIEQWATGAWKANKPVSRDYILHFKDISRGIAVHFQKVKAHSGVEFNEMADQLAKQALQG